MEKSFEFSTFFPYKCMGSIQMHREVKKIERQYTTIILAILVDLPSPMICAKIQRQGIFGSGADDFLKSLPYVGMTAILVNEPQPLYQSFVPPSKESV